MGKTEKAKTSELRHALNHYIGILVGLLMSNIPHENLCMIDIGAFDGRETSQFIDLHPGSTAHAIEPCPVNADYIRQKNTDGVQVHEMAIAGKNGEVCLYVGQIKKYGELGLSSQSNSLCKGLGGMINNHTVPALTLDCFCDVNNIERIDLLDINCEGSEFYILGGEQPVHALDRVNVIDLSLHGKYKQFLTSKMTRRKLDINRKLKSRGFKLMYGHDLLNMKKIPTGHMQQIWARSRML